MADALLGRRRWSLGDASAPEPLPPEGGGAGHGARALRGADGGDVGTLALDVVSYADMLVSPSASERGEHESLLSPGSPSS
jgi:hypothetical protein